MNLANLSSLISTYRSSWSIETTRSLIVSSGLRIISRLRSSKESIPIIWSTTFRSESLHMRWLLELLHSLVTLLNKSSKTSWKERSNGLTLELVKEKSQKNVKTWSKLSCTQILQKDSEQTALASCKAILSSKAWTGPTSPNANSSSSLQNLHITRKTTNYQCTSRKSSKTKAKKWSQAMW